MIFLTFAGPAYKRRVEVLHESIRKFHPENSILHHTLDQEVPSGQYYPDFHKVKWQAIVDILQAGKDLIFLGSDCEVLSPLLEIEHLLSYKYNAVIVPHAVSPVPDRTYMRQLYRTGHANSDIIAMSSTPHAIRIAKWMLEVTEDRDDGTAFYDQTWLSSLPFLFSGVHILRHPGYNVGYWDINQRDLTDIRVMHYSGFMEGQPERLSRYYQGPNATGKILELYKAYDEKLKGGSTNEASK